MRTAGNRATRALVQRRIELRPPGRGEASAFDRRQELVDRLNAVSGGLSFRLEDRVLVYDVVDEDALTDFDRRMRDFIDRDALVPLRLINRHAYVDIDDLLGGEDLSFQMVMVHFLAERFSVKDYARRIGTDMPFDAAHGVGREPMGNELWFRWRSREHRYRVIHRLRPRGAGLMTGEILILTFAGERVTVDEWRARGGAGAAAPAAVP
jgi:hypothetical protein